MISYTPYYNKAARAVPRGNPMKPPATAMPMTNKRILSDSQEGESMERPGISPAGLYESEVYSGEIGKDEPILSLDNENILKGFIFSEILAKPKSKRTGR